MRAVEPSAESATLHPNSPLPPSPFPVSLPPSCGQLFPERVNVQTAPFPYVPTTRRVSSPGPPTRAVLPSAESATRAPKRTSGPFPPFAFSLVPTHVPPPRFRKIQAASLPVPTRTVFPSADSAALAEGTAASFKRAGACCQPPFRGAVKIGRASCRERVYISVVA